MVKGTVILRKVMDWAYKRDQMIGKFANTYMYGNARLNSTAIGTDTWFRLFNDKECYIDCDKVFQNSGIDVYNKLVDMFYEEDHELIEFAGFEVGEMLEPLYKFHNSNGDFFVKIKTELVNSYFGKVEEFTFYGRTDKSPVYICDNEGNLLGLICPVRSVK